MKSLLRSILFFLFTLLSLPLWAQDDEFHVPDSLVAKLKEFRKADYQRAEALDACIEFFYEEEKIEDAAPYINELEQLANELNDRYWLAKSDYYQGLYAYASLDVEEAFARLNKAQNIAESMQESATSQTLLARIFLAKSAAYMKVDLMPDAYEAIEKGLSITDQYGLDDIKCRLINNKASLFFTIGNFEESLLLMKSLVDRKDANPEWQKNIAKLYCELGSADSALILIDSICASMPASEKKADVLITKCFILNRMSNWEASERYLIEAQEMLPNESPLWGLLHMRLAEAYMGENRFDEALHEINDALAIGSSASNMGLESTLLHYKSYIMSNLGDYKTAFECLDSYIVRYDTILNRNSQKLAVVRYQHDFEKMRKQYESEKALLRMRQTFIFIITGIVILFLGLLVFSLWKNKKRKEEMLKLELDYKNREITSKALNQNQGNETLNEVVQDLTHYLNNPRESTNVLSSAIRKLKGLVDDGSMSEFDYYFVEVHPDFYANLKKDFPNLTQNELRLCAFAKLNLPLKKIAEINNVSLDSVKSSRKRLRKSLGISDPKIDLAEFLSKY